MPPIVESSETISLIRDTTSRGLSARISGAVATV